MSKETLEAKFESYFLPFSTQIDAITTISQSGLISQIISLNSEIKNTIHNDVVNAIQKINKQGIIINIHCIYGASSLKPEESLLQYLKNSYKSNIYPQKEYSQNFFITISIKGYEVSKQNIANLLLQTSFLSELERSANKLKKIVEEFNDELEGYSPKVLKVVETNNELFSESAEFLHRIVYGTNAKIPLSNMEISEQIRPNSIKINTNSLQIKANKNTTYIACITVKDFPKGDKLQFVKLFTLKLPFVISQTIHSVKKEEIKSLFEYQAKITSSIKDNNIAEKCGWNNIIASKHPIAMQTNITIHAESLEELEQRKKILHSCLQNIGLICVVEDVNLEQAFYASMPSNASFCNRFEYGTIENAGQFLLSKNTIFEGINEVQNMQFMPFASVQGKYYGLTIAEKKKSYNLLIHGIHSESLLNAVNTMLLHLQIGRIVTFDVNYSTLGLNKLRNGLYFKTPEFNILNLFRINRKSFEIFFISLVRFVCKENKIQTHDSTLNDIRKFIESINLENSYDDICKIPQNPIIMQTLTFAKQNGFFSENDALLRKNKFISINSGGANHLMCGMFALYIMLFCLHNSREYDIIKLDKTFDVFDPKVIPPEVIVHILRQYKLKLVSLICCCNIPYSFEEKQIYRYTDVFQNFDIKFFAQGSASNYFIKLFFQLNSEITKHLMFIGANADRLVVQDINYSYMVDLANFNCNELSILNTKNKNFTNIIKLVENNKSSSQNLITEYIRLISQ